jgi:hypothetical protein
VWVEGQGQYIVGAKIKAPSALGGSSRREHHDANVVRLLRTFDFGEKVAAIELGRIRTQDHCVRIEGEDRLHSLLLVGRDLVSRIAQHSDELRPESIIGFHH